MIHTVRRTYFPMLRKFPWIIFAHQLYSNKIQASEYLPSRSKPWPPPRPSSSPQGRPAGLWSKYFPGFVLNIYLRIKNKTRASECLPWRSRLWPPPWPSSSPRGRPAQLWSNSVPPHHHTWEKSVKQTHLKEKAIKMLSRIPYFGQADTFWV